MELNVLSCKAKSKEEEKAKLPVNIHCWVVVTLWKDTSVLVDRSLEIPSQHTAAAANKIKCKELLERNKNLKIHYDSF